MQAIYQIEHGDSSVLKYGQLPIPKPQPLDVVVNNQWIGINPIDIKVRSGKRGGKQINPQNPLILGWSTAGIVSEVGSEVTNFSVGDEVYYSGTYTRPGSYAQYTAVDSRVVAKKPSKLDFSEAASVPLVAVTAWETLVEDWRTKEGDQVLIYNGAGGVGSFAIQLAKHLGAEVVATASRPETIEFCKSMGADHVINHRQQLQPQLQEIGIPEVDQIFICYSPEKIVPEIVQILKPLGKISVATEPEEMRKMDFMGMFLKRQRLFFSSMVARCSFGLEQEKQGEILQEVAKLFDKGILKHTVTKKFGWKEMVDAHSLLESGKVFGKVVVQVEQQKIEE